jgi:hypothetical protein
MSANYLLCCLRNFTKLCQKYAVYWTELDEIDSNAKVVGNCEMNVPWRTIELERFVSVKFWINPENPSDVDEFQTHLQFFGNPDRVSFYSTQWRQRSSLWNKNDRILKNLMLVFEKNLQKAFVTDLGAPSSELSDVCAICYASDDGDLLDVLCACKHAFHSSCIASVRNSLNYYILI